MKQQEIFGVVCEVLRDRLYIDQPVHYETEIGRDLQLDSVHQMTLLVELEERFHIVLEVEDDAGIHTVGDMVRLIAQTLQANRSPDTVQL